MGNSDEINKEERKYWLWVADSRSWLDEDGKDAKDLDPNHEMDPEKDWWTCNKDVQKGDLAFLWRTRRGTGQKSDIGYLMEIKSEAFIPQEWELGTWKYWCLYKPLFKFMTPVTIEDFKGVPCLENWGVYRAHFQRHSYEIPKKQWEMLNQIASKKNPGYGDFIKRILEQSLIEKVEQKDAGIQKEKAGQVTIPIENIDKPQLILDSLSLNINDFRLPEELAVYTKIKDHPGAKKLEILFPEIFQQQEQPETSFLQKNQLIKEGVRITKSSRPDVIETFEKSFSMFREKQQFEVFTQKNLSESENATVFIENGLPIFVFMHDILRTFTQNEIKSVIGHELGHFLLGHTLRNDELVRVGLALSRAKELEILNNHPDLLDLILYVNISLDDEGNIKYLGGILPQLQELSADRIGLLVSRDLQSSITGLVKIAGGSFSDTINITEYIDAGKRELRLEADDIYLSHPYGPKRSWALQFFSETDLFKKAIGMQGGKPISEISKILPEIVPFPEDEIIKQSPIEAPMKIQDYILQLYFFNGVAWADGKLTPSETKVITQFVPPTLRDEVFQKWNDLNDDSESKSDEYNENISKQYFADASPKDSRWKTTLIKRMIKVARANRRVTDEELDEIAAICDLIDAKNECSKQFLKEFGYDPFA